MHNILVPRAQRHTWILSVNNFRKSHFRPYDKIIHKILSTRTRGEISNWKGTNIQQNSGLATLATASTSLAVFFRVPGCRLDRQMKVSPPKQFFLSIIPRSRMGYWVRSHEGERNNCFGKSQVVCQKISTQNNLKQDYNPFLPPKNRRFSLLVGYNI